MSKSMKKQGGLNKQKQQGEKETKRSGNSETVHIKNQNSFRKVFFLFCIASLIHILLNIVVNEAPKVTIDEGLYTNIARSLAWDGELAFRGQPINYPYLLYSFLLVPVYWLNRLLGGDVYRYVQVFNTLLITSSVFPVYLFACDFTEDEPKSLVAAFTVSLMPDMLMGGYEMTECLIWPLSFWMIVFCYRYYSNHQIKDGLLAALFTGLMFACKPGAISMGAVLLVINCILVIKNKGKIISAVLPLAALAGIVAGVYIIFLLLFHGGDSLLGLYVKQTSEWSSKDVPVAIEAFFLLTFLFIFACGGFFCLFPYTHLKEYDSSKRSFAISVAIGVLTAVAGTAVFVVPYKWTGELGHLPLHLRYSSMFIPLMYVFTIDIIECRSKSKAYIVALIAFIVFSVFPGARAGFVDGKTGTVDSLALNAFAKSRNLDGTATGWCVTILVIAFSFVFLSNALRKKTFNNKKNRELYTVCNVFFLIFILFNSICAHIHANIYIDPTISKDALEINRIIGNKRCLGITQRYYDDIYSYWLDSRLNVPMQQVTIDQMFVQMEETEGLYSPFVPVEQSPNVNNHETPETDTFVLGKTIAEHLELSDSVLSSQKTANGHFAAIQIDPSSRWVDTMLYGLDDNSLYPEASAFLHVFDEDRNADGVLNISVSASGDGVLRINGETIPVEQQKKTFHVSVPFTDIVPIEAEGGTVQIYSYSTQKAPAEEK